MKRYFMCSGCGHVEVVDGSHISSVRVIKSSECPECHVENRPMVEVGFLPVLLDAFCAEDVERYRRWGSAYPHFCKWSDEFRGIFIGIPFNENAINVS